MINTPPSERPQSQQNNGPLHGGMSGGPGGLNPGLNGPPMHNTIGPGGPPQNKPYLHDSGSYKPTAPGIPRNPDEFMAGSALPAASAAVALAQLHNHKLDREWDEGVSLSMGDVSPSLDLFPYLLHARPKSLVANRTAGLELRH